MRIYSIFLLMMGTFAMAQTNKDVQDPEAKAILDKVAQLAKSTSAISLSFTYKAESLVDKSNITQTGTAWMKGEKYKIDLKESQLYFDGTNLYNYIVDAKEVNIMKPEGTYDEFFLANPSKIFTLYQKDYKYRLVGEAKLLGIHCYEIHMFPFSLERGYSRVVVYVDKSTHYIVSVRLHGKSGDRYTIDLKDYKTNLTLNDTFFVFDRKKHPGVEVIDMRE